MDNQISVFFLVDIILSILCYSRTVPLVGPIFPVKSIFDPLEPFDVAALLYIEGLLSSALWCPTPLFGNLIKNPNLSPPMETSTSKMNGDENSNDLCKNIYLKEGTCHTIGKL